MAIGERLRKRVPVFGPLSDLYLDIGEAADTIDALAAALEAVSPLVHKLDVRRPQIDAALALARGGK